MMKFIVMAVLTTVLSGCSGILAYEDNKKIWVGNLAKNNLNKMNSTGSIRSRNNEQRFAYGLNGSGSHVGVCRTTFASGSDNIPGDTDFGLFNVARQEIYKVSHNTITKAVDRFASTLYSDWAGPDPNKYLHCYKVGTSGNRSHLVLYFQPQGGESIASNFAIDVETQGNVFTITDFELFDRSSAPTRVIASDNPLKGNSVSITTNGKIHINGTSVLLNGSAVSADSVSHYFK